MNSISVAGQLGRDAELKYLNNGDAVLNFSVADSQGKDKPTIWWNCQLFGKRAESLDPYLKKGQSVTVVGSVSEREWTDRDGNVKKSMNVRVNELALMGGKPSESRQAESRPKPQRDEDDGDIPF